LQHQRAISNLGYCKSLWN